MFCNCSCWCSLWREIKRRRRNRGLRRLTLSTPAISHPELLIVLDLNKTFFFDRRDGQLYPTFRNVEVMRAILELSSCHIAVLSHESLTKQTDLLDTLSHFIGSPVIHYMDLDDLTIQTADERRLSPQYQQFLIDNELTQVVHPDDHTVDFDKVNLIGYLVRKKYSATLHAVQQVIVIDNSRRSAKRIDKRESMRLQFSAIYTEIFPDETYGRLLFASSSVPTLPKITQITEPKKDDRLQSNVDTIYPIQLAKQTGVHDLVLAKNGRGLDLNEQIYWDFYCKHRARVQASQSQTIRSIALC